MLLYYINVSQYDNILNNKKIFKIPYVGSLSNQSDTNKM